MNRLNEDNKIFLSASNSKIKTENRIEYTNGYGSRVQAKVQTTFEDADNILHYVIGPIEMNTYDPSPPYAILKHSDNIEWV